MKFHEDRRRLLRQGDRRATAFAEWLHKVGCPKETERRFWLLFVGTFSPEELLQSEEQGQDSETSEKS